MTNKQLQIIRLHRVFFGPLFTTPTLIEYYSKMSPISDETTQTFDDSAVYPLTENAYERLKKEDARDLALTVIRFENEDIVCTIEEAKELNLYQPDAKVRIMLKEYILGKTIKALMDEGYEEFSVSSADCYDYINFRSRTYSEMKVGWVRFAWNNGGNPISDYTIEHEHLFEDLSKLEL